LTPRVPTTHDAAVSARLAETSLWSALDNEEREAIFSNARIVAARKDQVLVEAGTQASALFLVVEGALRLTRMNGHGHRIIAGFLFRGDIVGACIADCYPFSVEAIDEVVLCRVERRRIQEMNRDNMGLEWRMITVASNEFLQCQTHLDIVMGGSVEAKLSRFLLHIAGRIGQPDAGGKQIALPMSREDIAHYLGHSLETISRAFTKLRDSGAIATPQRHHLIIADEAALARTAEIDA